MSVDFQPPQCLAKPIAVPSKLLMGAGPSNAAENVLKAGSLPLLGHLHTEFTQVILLLDFDLISRKGINFYLCLPTCKNI